jgi:hypothetical protein
MSMSQLRVTRAVAGLDMRWARLPCLAGGAARVFECDYEEVVCHAIRLIFVLLCYYAVILVLFFS